MNCGVVWKKERARKKYLKINKLNGGLFLQI